MKLMKKAVPHTIAGIRKAPMNICFIHRLPVRRNIPMESFQKVLIKYQQALQSLDVWFLLPQKDKTYK